MKIHPIASTVSDNWFYLVTDGPDAMLVDPIDAKAAVAAYEASGAENVFVFTTHGHPDHVGGNDEVKKALGCEIVGSAHGSLFPKNYDRTVSEGDTLTVGGTTFELIHAPGHTDGHLVAYTPGHLISGDIYFVGGSGHCKWGGEPGELHRTFTQRLAHIPDDTNFYPGHDYAQHNLAFCIEIEPNNAEAKAFADKIRQHTRDDGPVLTTLGHERSYNPFHRSEEPALQAYLFETHPNRDAATTDPGERTFRIVRGLRDHY